MTEGEISAPDSGGGTTAATAEVKGWRNGLLVILPAGISDWNEVIERIHARLDEAKARSFWRGAQTTIDCGTRAVTAEEMDALRERLKNGFGLVPVAVVTTNPVTRAAAERAALTVYDELPSIRKAAPPAVLPVNHLTAHEAGGEPATAAPPPAPAAASAPPAIEATATPAAGTGDGNNALYVPQTVRSGQRIAHDGHIVISGDVNAGAEVVAGGDILIFGVLRGLAHAGCYGDDGARIVAISLKPPQLRIASKIARAPEEAPRGSGGKAAPASPSNPEVARIVNGEIQVFPL